LEDRLVPAGEPLTEPPVLQSVNGVLNATLTLQTSTVNVDGVLYTGGSTYNGLFPGPTLWVNPGDVMNITLVNALTPESQSAYGPTNLHTHGLHVSPLGNSDNVLLNIEPGETNQFRIQIPSDHPQGLYWYHPHRHEFVQDQVFGGASGLLVIGNPSGGFPELAGLRQHLMAIKNVQTANPFTGVDNGVLQLAEPPQSPPFQTHLVNGILRPTITQAPGEAQVWNLANIGSDAFYNLVLRDPVSMVSLPFLIVAQDGNPYTLFQTTTRLVLSPGNRYSVVVQVPAGTPLGTNFELIAEPFNQGLFLWPNGAPGGPAPTPVVLATMTVTAQPFVPFVPPTQGTSPSSNFVDLRGLPIAERRVITFDQPPNEPTIFTIDGKLFPNREIIQPRLNTVEEWVIRNTTSEIHPFHIHQNDFQVISINGIPLDPNGPPIAVGDDLYTGGLNYQDINNIPPNGEFVIRMQFLDFLGTYVYHCHILFHEDHGMMALVKVVPEGPIFTMSTGTTTQVKAINPATNATVFDFYAFDPTVYAAGVRTAVGDVNGDGINDIIAVMGPGGDPQVKVFSGKDGAQLYWFYAFDPSIRTGLYVAAGDINSDGYDDIIVSLDAGLTPEVKVFGGGVLSGQQLLDFYAYDPFFQGGVTLATGDINGDGRIDLVTGTGLGAPHVKVFSTMDLMLIASFFAYDPAFQGGVFVAVANTKGFAFDDIITGTVLGAPNVKVYTMPTGHHFEMEEEEVMTPAMIELEVIDDFFAYDPAFQGGVRVAGLHRSDGDDLVTAPGFGAPADVRIFDRRHPGAATVGLVPFVNYHGGVYVGGPG
jgi:FtsP/CotA-like multicopper oxidase with cupredoxin domain